MPPGGKRKGAGRKPRLSGDDLLMDRLVKLRRRSLLFDNQIAIKCGLHPATLRRWLALGLAPDAREPYRSFAQKYSEAKTAVEEAQLSRGTKLGKEGSGNRWWLEKSFPKRYGSSVPASGPAQAIEIEDILKEVAEKPQTLDELLSEPPLELQEAMIRNAAAIRAFLDAAVPLLVPGSGDAIDGAIGRESGNGERQGPIEGAHESDRDGLA